MIDIDSRSLEYLLKVYNSKQGVASKDLFSGEIRIMRELFGKRLVREEYKDLSQVKKEYKKLKHPTLKVGDYYSITDEGIELAEKVLSKLK